MFDQIYLDALGVTVEIEIRTFPGIERLFHLFKNDEVLEKAATQTVVHQLLRGVDSRQCAGESGVVKIDLWRFYETLAPVLVPWRQKEADVRCMEDGKPFRYRLRGDAAIVREGRDIENGTDAPHDELEECGKKHRVLDSQKLVDVALNIGADVTGKEYVRFCASSEDSRVSAVENRDQRICLRTRHRSLFHAERSDAGSDPVGGVKMVE